MGIRNLAAQAANFLAASALWIAAMSFFWIAFLCQILGRPFNVAAGIILSLTLGSRRAKREVPIL